MSKSKSFANWFWSSYWVDFIVMILVLAAGFCIGLGEGIDMGIDMMRHEAIKAGVAGYKLDDQTGRTTFVWKTIDK